MGVVKMMKMRHIVPMALMLLSVTACATASSSQTSLADINAHVIGNTVVGVDDGKPYQEYYNPNGTIEGVDTEDYTGSWRVDGGKLCTGYESDDPKKPGVEWTCSGVSVSGDSVTWVDGEGDRTEAKLLPGKQLPQPAQAQ